MPAPRKLIGPLVIGLLILFAVPANSGASPATQTRTDSSSQATQRQTVRETVTWTLPANQCPNIPDKLSVAGAGQRVMHTRTRTGDKGTKQVRIEDTVKGPAIDSAGREYRFFYYNLSTQVIPASGGPIKVHMIDVFRLRRTDHSNHHGSHRDGFKGLRVDFDWTWTFTPPHELWPPQNNLKKSSTHGDPFLCDPI
jgi:hypothetical protein